jgi:hypothetical protein
MVESPIGSYDQHPANKTKKNIFKQKKLTRPEDTLSDSLDLTYLIFKGKLPIV